MFLSLFNSFASANAPPDIVCLQDPPVWRSRLPSFTSFASFHASTAGNCKPRVTFYVSTTLLARATVLPAFFDRLDVAALDFYGSGLFGGSFPQFRILNIYNLRANSPSCMTVSPVVSFPEIDFPLLAVGDFNIHHPLSDPLRAHSSDELGFSFPYFSRASELGCELLNTPGVYTRFPLGGIAQPSVTDLFFASPLLAPYCRQWSTPLPSTGSDHVPISIVISHPLLTPPALAPNWSLTDWDSLTPLLDSFRLPPLPLLPTRSLREAWFDRHLSSLTSLLTSHTAQKRPSHRSKPWWSPPLFIPRHEHHSAACQARSSHLPSNQDAARLSKSGYFKAIKAAISSHCKSLLSSATPSSIWAVKKLAMGRSSPRFLSLPGASTPTQMNNTLLGHFFPPLPPHALPCILTPYADYVELSPNEISRVL